MDTITIIGILVLAAFAVPVAIVLQKQNREKKKLVQMLAKLDQENQISITEHEVWRNKLIGLDPVGKKAVFIVKNPEGNQVNIVDLQKVARCEVEKFAIASETDSSLQAISQVRIRFIPREKNQKDQHFILFNEETDQSLGVELRIGNDWIEKFSRIVKIGMKAA
ncbi:MAG TPA: hypothetical protein DCY35_01015 [Prolixibacteraceae bacterium]|nr:hypothetical protein [Prolixibacteraceae bacterium]